jgi:bifunctional DNA-binding transcriptional regulator/antitoxin component of YhaV-PrlF toxin-antitoxin module
VIPVELRKKYSLRKGSQVMLVDYGGVLAIVPILANPVSEAAGMLKGDSSLVSALHKERQQEILREP